MASHYVSVNQGEQGMASVDFTVGTSSTGTDQVELRVLDGAGLSKKDVLIALKAFERFFEDYKQVTAAAFDVSG